MGGRSGPIPTTPSPLPRSDDDQGDDLKCPKKVRASISGPSEGIAEGSYLAVQLDQTSLPERVVLFDEATNSIVGALAGIPNLPLLMRCLREGVEYLAYVEEIDGGRIDVILARQDR